MSYFLFNEDFNYFKECIEKLKYPNYKTSRNIYGRTPLLIYFYYNKNIS